MKRLTWTLVGVIGCLMIATAAVAVISQPPGHFAYITNWFSGTVSFIDTDTRVVTRTTTVGSLPQGVAVGASGFYVYVTNTGSKTVSKVSTVTGSVVATINTGVASRGIAVNNDETLAYVPDVDSNKVLVIDLLTNTVLKSVTVGNSPQGITMDPAGEYLYVANMGDNTVSMIHHSGVFAGTIAVGAGPWQAAVHPSGSSIWVTNYVGDSISVINRHEWSVTTIPVGDKPMGISFNRAGTYAYVANYGSDTVSIIKTATKSVTATIPVGNGPGGLAVDRSDRYLYVANANDQNVVVIDTTTNGIVAIITAGNEPRVVGQFINASSVWKSDASVSMRATYPEEDAKGNVKLKSATRAIEGVCYLYATYRKPVKLSCRFTDGTYFELDNMGHLSTENPKSKTETVTMNGSGRGAVYLPTDRLFPGGATLTDGKGLLKKATAGGEVTSITLNGKMTINADTGVVGTATLRLNFSKI